MDEIEIKRWNRASDLLDEILDLPVDEQQSAVIELGISNDVPKELSRLYASTVQSSVLDAPLADAIEKLPTTPGAAKGSKIGNWILGDEIGRGGMSVIYHASRDGEDFDQHAALKLMSIAFLDEHFIDSFLRERQILSDLQHPSIARLIDGGLTEDGSPFLVMQYVEGQPIDQWCAEHNADLQTVCRLMIKLCQAVAYAQNHLIVHQDIKPGNVLVDEHSRPILIDFGIARLLGSSSSESALKAFTPDFAAPEQVSGEPITTATDVYSLGVLFRKLVDGMRVDSDLEAILAVATHPAPEERYANARNLTEDIQAWLDKRPLRAIPPTATYRAGRFIARNKWGVAAAALIVISLMGGLAAALWQAKVAETERDLAQTQSARAMQATEFLKDLFRASDPDRSKGENVSARDLLDQGAYQVQHITTEDTGLKAEMLVLLGSVNREIGDLDTARILLEEGLDLSEASSEIDQRVKAKHELVKLMMETGEHEKALAIANQTEAELVAANQVPGRQHATLMNSILFTLDELGRTDEALTRGQAALTLARQKPNIDSQTLFNYVYSLATPSLIAEKIDEAEALLNEATELVGINASALSMQADFYSNLSGVYARRGESTIALEHSKHALQIASTIYPPVHLTRARLLSNLANKYSGLGRYTESEQAARESLDIYQQLYPGEANPRVAAANNNLGHALQQAGRYADAEPFVSKAREMAGDLLGRDDMRYAFATNNLGMLKLKLGELGESEQLLNQSLEIRQNKFGSEHWTVGTALTALAQLRLAQNQPGKALELNDQVLELFKRIDHKNARNIVATQTYRAEALAALDRKEEAEKAFELALKTSEDAGADTGSSMPVLMAAYEGFLKQQDDPGAQQKIERARKTHRELMGEAHTKR